VSTPSSLFTKYHPCDFWAFEKPKGTRKDRSSQGSEEIGRTIQEAWTHVTFEDFENVFKSWISYLYFLKKWASIQKVSPEISASKSAHVKQGFIFLISSAYILTPSRRTVMEILNWFASNRIGENA
jgi:hypothetical protein